MIAREALRYLVAGAAYTLLTYVLYLVLLQVLHYRWAYLLAFIAGIGLSFLLLRHVVFERPGKRFALAYVASSHALQLALGLMVVEAWVAWLRGPAWLAPLVAAVVCVPVMFALQRWIFTSHAAR